MKTLEDYRKKGLEMGMDGAKVIDPRSIITAEWVRLKCQFGCSRYGRGLCCPPFTPTPEVTRKVIDSYEKAILCHRVLDAKASSNEFKASVVRLEITIFLDGYYKAWSMGSGPCRLCEECDTSSSCKHGVEARPSMEACGIDVFATARNNEFPIQVVQSPEGKKNQYGLVLVE